MKSGWLIVIITSLLLAGCGPTMASVDYTYAGGIVWPGAPEKPRIQYLWGVARVSGSPDTLGGRLVGRLAGAEGAEQLSADPKDSGYLYSPHGVFVDSQNVLYITDTGLARVVSINLESMESRVIERMGKLDFSAPISVVASGDRIYISDADLKVVAMLDRKGRLVGFFEGKFERPTGLALNTVMGRIFVADTWGHKIYEYSLEGKRLREIGLHGDAEGSLNYPTHIAVDHKGFLYVSDTLNFRVQVFSPEGRFVRAFGLPGDSFAGFEKIKGISVDSFGNIYVTDSAQDMVKVFDSEGRLLMFFGSKGNYYGQFLMPTGIYIDASDRIFVSDTLNGRVQVFRLIDGT